jgi:hypothetical protein
MEVIEELFESFEELCDPKGKRPSRRHGKLPEPRRRSGPDTGIVRELMRRVERRSQERMHMEQERIERVRLEVRSRMGRPARHTESSMNSRVGSQTQNPMQMHRTRNQTRMHRMSTGHF